MFTHTMPKCNFRKNHGIIIRTVYITSWNPSSLLLVLPHVCKLYSDILFLTVTSILGRKIRCLYLGTTNYVSKTNGILKMLEKLKRYWNLLKLYLFSLCIAFMAILINRLWFEDRALEICTCLGYFVLGDCYVTCVCISSCFLLIL